MNTFKPSSKSEKRKYDENQYLSPAEYHSYSAVDSDTQFYMDDGLSSLKRCKNVIDDDDEVSNNYVEVMDEVDELTRSRRPDQSSATSSTSESASASACMSESSLDEMQTSFKLKNPTVTSSSSALALATAAQATGAAFNLVQIDSNENLKAKKILQRI